MNILHIGKPGNMERFSAPDSLLYSSDAIDMPSRLTDEEYASAAPDTEHIIVDAITPVSAELIAAFPRLKSIHSEGVAYNRIDVEAASGRGICVCHSRGMNASAVAEQTVLLMSGMLKNIVLNDAAVRNGSQISVKESYMQRGDLMELADCSVGLVGFGNIAEATAHLLKAYGVSEIFYYKRHRLSSEREAALGISFRPLSELLSVSDIVSLHCPVTRETEKMADAAFFGKMKDGAYFVNTARGELVDDTALADALRSGKLKMAGLDTLNNEPVTVDNYLLSQSDIRDRLLLSPHIGGITASSFRRSYRMIWEDIKTVSEGGIPSRAVNLGSL
ncbi:MAG: NAD(P)-dependent oxidoreductase [Clostridiales bacterium]|nr:NAD(P)-dependent oxidoreductase [Clostridiales bacterium]